MVGGIDDGGSGVTFVLQTVVDALEHVFVVSKNATKRNSMKRLPDVESVNSTEILYSNTQQTLQSTFIACFSGMQGRNGHGSIFLYPTQSNRQQSAQ